MHFMTFARFAAILVALALIAVLLFFAGLKPRAHHVVANAAHRQVVHRAA
jgi:hypothetical protein